MKKSEKLKRNENKSKRCDAENNHTRKQPKMQQIWLRTLVLTWCVVYGSCTTARIFQNKQNPKCKQKPAEQPQVPGLDLVDPLLGDRTSSVMPK